MQMAYKDKVLISRSHQMLHKVVIIDGFPGCGKTMLSPIISSMDNVEIMQYAPLIEQMCELYGLNSIEEDIAKSMIKMNADLLIYNVMMGRNSNCRPSDLSSIFRHNFLLHLKRMISKGDEYIPDLILKKRPILQLTTHMLLPHAKLLMDTFGQKLAFIEVIRHPLYVILQQELNLRKIGDDGDSRMQHIRYRFNNNEYEFYCKNREKDYDEANSFERAIYSIQWYYSKIFLDQNKDILVIPFEKFVIDPSQYMTLLTKMLGQDITNKVTKEMKKQKVPRSQLSDGPALDIYKRCGWTPPQFYSEEKELLARREVVLKNVSPKALAILDDISNKYSAKYLN
tara:strand:- start:3313 stop:4335 length:1023 start_codon:yes stop_codon:yes gene_type:complete